MKSKWLSKIRSEIWCTLEEFKDGSMKIIDAWHPQVKDISYLNLDEFLKLNAHLRVYQDITFKDHLLNTYTNINKLNDNICKHEYKSYRGFTDNYEFCIHCDNKRNL